MKNLNHLISYPVAMYDIQSKKCVALFKSRFLAGTYVFGVATFIGGSAIPERKVYTAKRCKRNPYGRDITFRAANKEQTELLAGKDVMVIDPKFANPDKDRSMDCKTRKGNGHDIMRPMPKPVKNEKGPIIQSLARQGHTLSEITEKVKMASTSVAKYLEGIPALHAHITDWSSEKLEEYIVLCNNRLEMLKNLQL